MQTIDSLTADLMPQQSEATDSKYFHGGHWGQCLELLSHLCQYSDNILLVTGPNGIGKTALKHALMESGANKFSFCEIVANERLDRDQLLTQIENGFAHFSDQYFEPLNTNGILEAVLLIEDAHLLSLEELAVLLQLQKIPNSQRRLHIVLFAGPQLEQKIQRSPLRGKFAELVHTIELEPLTFSEVESFLDHECNLDKNSEISFDKATCKKIYTQSNGIPGNIKQIVKNIKDGNNVKQNILSIRRMSPFSVGLIVTCGLLFCLLAFLWPAAEETTIAQVESEVVPDIGGDLQPISSYTAPSYSDTTVNTPEVIDVLPQGAMLEPVQSANEPTLATTTDTNKEVTGFDNYEEKIARLEQKLLALQQQVEVEQGARRSAELKVQKVLQRAEDTALGTKVKPKAKAKTKVKAKSNLAGSVASTNLAVDKQILELPSKNYTLQLLGSSNEQRVKEFIKTNKLGEKAYYYRSSRNGKPWFIIVYGNFANKAAAVAARKALPEKIKKLKPWMREIALVQNEIKKQ